ncbi:MAG: hypothetical protein HC859_08180 [Bacteroidia bacterium]|nr:hypothetical protein [Bacteroidia bacterium]
MVSDIPYESVMKYQRTFNEKLSTLSGLRNHKFNTFVISKDNFNILYRTKGIDEYLRFYDKNYQAENP